jgi:restriction endonuclease S subunit
MEHLSLKTDDLKSSNLEPIAKYIEEVNCKFTTNDFDDLDAECAILSVTKNGIYINETYTVAEMNELSQKYKRVFPGDFTYNPHRVNIGSIGVVPNLHNYMYVPTIYPVFRIIDSNKLPEYYLLKLLKNNTYRSIINHYCLGGARANLKLDWLSKIKILLPNEEEKKKINNLSNKLKEKYNEYLRLYKSVMD